MDEVLLSRFKYQPSEDKLYRELTQPSEEAIFAQNAEIRKDESILRDLSFGRKIASIPFITYEQALRDGYDLNSPDSEIADREMTRFLLSEKGQRCLMRRPKNGIL